MPSATERRPSPFPSLGSCRCGRSPPLSLCLLSCGVAHHLTSFRPTALHLRLSLCRSRRAALPARDDQIPRAPQAHQAGAGQDVGGGAYCLGRVRACCCCILSYPILSYLTVSYLISSYPILSSYLIPSHHPSSLHPIPSHFESHSHPTFHPQPQPQPQGSRMFDVMVAAIAFVGFLWQVRSGFSLSFPLNLLLLPFTICEWFLMWLLQ